MKQIPLNDAVPPYHEEAEMATIGALLLNFSINLLDDVQQFIGASDFFKGAHQLIFKGIVSLHDKGEGVDIITLTEELTASGDIGKVGGASYVASLTSRVPATANVLYYAKIVQETSVRRNLLNVAHSIISQAHNETLEIRSIIEDSEKSIFDLVDNQSRGELKPVKVVTKSAMDIIDKRARSKVDITGIPSGLRKLDEITNGFHESEFTIIGARPSIGKTALALSIAANISIKKKIPCGFFTLEMSDVSLMMRILSSESNVNANLIRSGLLNPKNFTKLTSAAGRIYEAPLILQDTPNIPLLDLRSLARKMVSKYDVKIIFIDYIGLITPEDKSLPRYEQISGISRSLKALARELDIPIVALAQVGRQSQGKMPTLADLRESGALEQDADVVLFLHRETEKNKAEESYENSSFTETFLSVAKQRNGPTDTMKVEFVPHFARFQDLQREDY